MAGLTGQEGERGPNNTFSFFLLILFCFVLRTLRSFSFNGKYMSVFQDGANPTTVTSAYLFNTELGIKSTKSFRLRLRSHGSPMSRDKKKTTTSRWFTLWFVCNPEKPSSQVLRSPEQVVFVSSVCVCASLFHKYTMSRHVGGLCAVTSLLHGQSPLGQRNHSQLQGMRQHKQKAAEPSR